MLVALFLTVRIVGGSLESAWAVVALSDASVAVVQIVILRKGWWREVIR
jgi:Na+-driven multidrug efflux pump